MAWLGGYLPRRYQSAAGMRKRGRQNASRKGAKTQRKASRGAVLPVDSWWLRRCRVQVVLFCLVWEEKWVRLVFSELASQRAAAGSDGRSAGWKDESVMPASL